MRFILEENKPFLGHRAVAVIHLHGHDDGAGVDFIGFLHILELSFFFQLAHSHESQIHKADELVIPALKNLLPGIQIALVGAFHGRPVIALTEFHVLQLGGEGGMAAVIRPVGIQHADFRHGRISFFFPGKIVLDMLEILEGHCQAQRGIQSLQLLLGQILETVKNFHIRGFFKHGFQRFRLYHIRFPGIHRVDAVCLYSVKLVIRQLSGNQIGYRRPDDRLFLFVQKLHALQGRIRSLVKLSGQKFHGKNSSVLRNLNLFSVKNIYRRFGKHRGAGLFKNLVADMLHIVADEHPHILYFLQVQIVLQIAFQFLRFHGKRGFLLYIDTSYISHEWLLQMFVAGFSFFPSAGCLEHAKNYPPQYTSVLRK